MAEYYLISQLPSLDGISEHMPLPMTEERLWELCGRFLGKRALGELEHLTLVPSVTPEQSSSALVTAWNDGERRLRLALAKVRADRMNKSFDVETEAASPEIAQVATAAVEADNPLEAEILLLNYRLSFLEDLRPMDGFSEDYIFYYALKLKLISRIRQFDTALGKATYQNIYNSILNGDGWEA